MSSELKSNLEKFITHCQELKQEDDPSGDGFTREFRDLREKQMKEKEENKFPAEEGKRHVNVKKNRYKDIIPYDEYRVILNGREDGEDYINASYIKGANGEKNYIASQGPLPHTINDFIRMLWQKKTEIVFMACRTEEGEPKKKKCEKYWTDTGESKEFGEITVTTEEETLPMKDFYRRRICLSCDGSHHRLTQFHYIGWPDHGIPDHPSLLNIMINHMRIERKEHDIPLVVHCSAGCGRTGTICAIDYAWTLLNDGKIVKDFSLYDIILRMREQRQSMVQTPDQYELVHLVMENLFTEWIKNYELNNDVDTEQLYYNVNLDGEHEEEIYVNEDLTGDENIYTECDDSNNQSLPKPVVVPTNQYYSNVDLKETNQSTAQNVSLSRHEYDNRELPRVRSDSSSSSLNESTVVGDMYSMVDIHKKEMETPVKSTTKNPAEQVQGSPQLPPRNYTKEDIKAAKADTISSRPPKTLPTSKETKPAVLTGGGIVPRHHAVKSAPTGTVTSRGNIQHVIQNNTRTTSDGLVVTPLHRTFVHVPGRSAGLRRQPVTPPVQNHIKFKVGKEEMVLPNYPPSRMMPPPVVSYTTAHVQSGKPYIHQHYARDFYGYPIGYNHRPLRKPGGPSTPSSFPYKPKYY